MAKNALDMETTSALLRDASYALEAGNPSLAEDRTKRVLEALLAHKFGVSPPDKLVVVAQLWRGAERRVDEEVSV